MDEWMKERYSLAKNRIAGITEENLVQQPFADFFQKTAGFLKFVVEILEEKEQPSDLEELRQQNYELYRDILPEHYETSYGNPDYAGQMLGEYGKYFSFLYAELRGVVIYAFEKKIWDFTIALELFLEVYACFCDQEIPSVKTLKDILHSYASDYCQEFMEQRIEESVNPEKDFAVKIVMQADFTDLRYLYRYGEYISENELGVAQYLNTLSEEQIEDMARTYTEGYRIGFIKERKDLSKKKTVNIRYSLGFERMVRAAVVQFEKMGLKPVIYRYALHTVNKKSQIRVGFTGAVANPQYDYDHRQDCALYLDTDFVKRKLRAMQNAYEKFSDWAAVMGGPACIETFGEIPFAPVHKQGAWKLSESQQKLQNELDRESAQIVNRYIRGDERSFTIIAYPVPEIGPNFPGIFAEIVRINTLDAKVYEDIQQKIIDALDNCRWVEIKGAGKNETNLKIHLHTLEDPQKQTNFENCVADVNIPVGEVFTSPILTGTEGVLHVSKVYLNGLLYKNLKFIFADGEIVDYSCDNFENVQEGRAYIEDHILHNHPKLPMGEFAIGTNTTAYVAAQKYQIADKLPILIAEKMGPHFAVGDTCYSWAEDIAVFNPDGKEVIARDNEISELRKENVAAAYYNCHTDITIPYEELESIRGLDENGIRISIIEQGRFVLKGTELLNAPFAELD